MVTGNTGISMEYPWNMMVFNGHATGTNSLELPSIYFEPMFHDHLTTSPFRGSETHLGTSPGSTFLQSFEDKHMEDLEFDSLKV